MRLSAIISGALLVGSMLLAFLLQGVLARVMGGKGAYGQYAFYLTLANFLLLLIGLELPSVLMRELSRLRGAGQRNLLMPLARKTFLLKISFNIIVTSVLLAIGYVLFPSEWRFFACAVLIALLLSWNRVAVLGLRSLEWSAVSVAFEKCLTPLLLLLWVGSQYLWRNKTLMPIQGLKLQLAVIFLVALSAALTFFLLLKNNRSDIDSEATVEDALPSKRQLLDIAWPIVLGTGLTVLMSQVDILMLRTISGNEQTGVYFASLRISQFTKLPLMIVNVIAVPFYAKKFGAGDWAAIQAGARKFMMFLAPSVLVCGGTLLLIAPIALLLFGPGFEGGYSLLLILIAGQIINVFSGTSAGLLNMTGHEKACARIMLYATCSNIILNGLLIPIYGAMGAAIATAVGQVIWNLMIVVYMRKRLGVDTSVMAWISPVQREKV